MNPRIAVVIASLLLLACGSNEDKTAGPNGGTSGVGASKSDAATGGKSGSGGTSAGGSVAVDAASGGASDAEPDQTCTGVDCGLCGNCVVNAGIAECQCPTGYQSSGGKCVLNPNPCDTTSCAAGTACVPEAHCQPLGVCVQICDCSNCGNCGPDNSDGKWNDQQEYCGNPGASPATMKCNTPCAAGEGCLPYSPSICWPIEGCFSL